MTTTARFSNSFGITRSMPARSALPPPFPNNRIPTNRLDPTSIALLEFYPTPNQPTTALTRNYLSLQNNRTDKDQFNSRIDFVESAKSNWFGRFSWSDESIRNPRLYLN